MLNPSELLNHQAAVDFADEKGMEGIARDTLLNWANRAEQHHRWTDDETRALVHCSGNEVPGECAEGRSGFRSIFVRDRLSRCKLHRV